jgi:predicted peptidase
MISVARSLLVAGFWLLLAAGCAGGGDDRPSLPEGLTLRPLGSVDGAPAGYVEYLPPGYGKGNLRPLLVFLHGAGENGVGGERALRRVLQTALPALIRNGRWPASRPFVVLMPQHKGGYGVGGAGPLCPDAAEIHAFLRFAVRHYDVDRRRVYLTGISCGAYGIWDYLAAHSTKLVAAAIPIAGDGNHAFGRAGCALARVPIWAFHGARDDTVSVYGSIRPITLLRDCRDPAPVDLRLTVYPDVGHGGWSPTYDLSAGHDIYAWLLSHRRSTS